MYHKINMVQLLSSYRTALTLPLRPAHSMSKLRMRTGAIFNHSPSHGYETSSFHATSTSIWQCDLRHGDMVLPADWRTLYFPAGSSTQLHPIMLQSTINLWKTMYNQPCQTVNHTQVYHSPVNTLHSTQATTFVITNDQHHPTKRNRQSQNSDSVI